MSYVKPPYKVTYGGTGSTTASGARTNLGVPAITAVMLLDGSQAMTAAINLGGFRATNSATPTSSTDLATKGYVDNVATGAWWHAAARAGTTANITLSGEQTIDGVSVVTGDRVLVKNQSTGAENGVYVCDSGSWSYDADWVTGSVKPGSAVFVEEGSVNADSGWIVTTDGTITVGSTSVAFTQFTGAGQITAGDGLTKSGNTINAVGTSNRVDVSADAIDISTSYVGQASITTLGTIATGTWNATTIAIGKGGTGLTATPTNGQLLIGNGSGYTLATLTDGSGITVTEGVGSISIAVDTSVVVTLTGIQTLTNKTLTDPKVRHTPNVQTDNYTILTSDYIVVMEVSTSGKVATLPAGATGLQFVIKNAANSTNTIDVDPNGSEIIDNGSGGAVITLDIGESATLQWAALSTPQWVRI